MKARAGCILQPALRLWKNAMEAIEIAETGDMCVGFCIRQIPLLRDL